MAQDNISIVKEFIGKWEARDTDGLVAMVADDLFYHNIPMDPIESPEALRAFAAPMLEMASEVDWVIYHISECADGTVMTERLDRFCINGKWLEIKLMGAFEIKDGKIWKWRDYFDLGQFQAGMAAIS